MKNFDIEIWFSNLWNKIDDIDKKAFWVFFISMNVVYLYNSVFCLFGNHDVHAMFNELPSFSGIFMGRYTSAFLEPYLSNKTMIPMFINIILFFFLSLTAVMFLNWLKVKKTMFNFVLSGLFVLLTPCLYSILWYRITAFGFLMTLFFMVVSFFLCQKSNESENKYHKFLYIIFSVFFMTVFVFGAYQSLLCTVFGLLFIRIFSDILENNFTNIKQIFKSYIPHFFVAIFSLLINFIIFNILKNKGIIDLEHYANSLIGISNFFQNLCSFFVRTIQDFCCETYPYIGFHYKIIFVLIVLVSFLSACIYIKNREKNKKKIVLNMFLIICSYLFIFYVFNSIYFLSKNMFEVPRMFRFEYWTTIYFVFGCIILGLKYTNAFFKNINIILVSLSIFFSVQICFKVQQDQVIAQNIELYRIHTVKNLILSNKNYSNEDKYLYIQIGKPEFFDYVQNYRFNSFTNNFVVELGRTFADGSPYLYSLVHFPPEIKNINRYYIKELIYPSEIKDFLDKDVKNWLLTEAKAYPSPHSVFINKGRIFVVMDEKLLTAIKSEILQ